MELMTHGHMWDFDTGQTRTEGPCEGVWLYQRDVSVTQYENYFESIINTASVFGIGLSGVSVPGCDCRNCVELWSSLQKQGNSSVIPNVWKALLQLAVRKKFAVPVVALYSDQSDEVYRTRIIESDGNHGAFDARLDMSAEDLIGYSDVLDPDYYVSGKGDSGRIVEVVASGANQCFFCAHWSSMNPENSVAWNAFREIILRINSHLKDRIEWVTPSTYGIRLLNSRGNS